MEKIILLILSILLNPMPVMAEDYVSEKLEQVLSGVPNNLGAPISETQILGNQVVVNEAEETIFYGAISGPPAIFFAYNIDTGVLLDSHLLTFGNKSAKNCYAVDMGPDGILHIVTHSPCLFFRYNPKTQELKGYGEVFSETTTMSPGRFDSQGNYYFGTYPNAKLIRYHKGTDKLEDLGVMIPEGNYVRSISLYQDKVYMGGIGNPTTEFVRYDINTGIRTVLPNPSIPGIFASDDCNNFYSCTQDGKYLFVRSKMVNSQRNTYILAVFDFEKEEWIDGLLQSPIWLHTTKLYEGKIYYHTGGTTGKRNLVSYEPGSGRVTQTGIQVGDYMVNPEIVTLKNQKDFPGITIVAGADTHGIMLVNLETKKTVYIKDGLPSQKISIRTLKTGYENDLILSAYMGSNVVIYDRDLEQVKTTASCDQIEGIGVFNQKYYFGMYGTGQLLEFDPTLPGEIDVNPKQIGYISGTSVKQNRAFCVIRAEDNIVWGTVPDYGYRGGAIGIYNMNTKTLRAIHISNQSVSGLAYRNGKIYIATNIYGGLGIEAADEIAKIIRMDLETGSIEISRELVLSSDPNPQYFAGGLTFSPDGRLFVAAAQTLVQLDLETLRVVRELKIGDLTLTKEEFRWLPFSMAWSGNGLLITGIGNKITAVDVDTFEKKELYARCTTPLDIAPDGSIYFIYNSTDLMKLETIGLSQKLSIQAYDKIFQSYDTEQIGNKTISGRKCIVFATVPDVQGIYQCKEYGMVFSQTHSLPEIGKGDTIWIPGEEDRNSLGQYGILFYGKGLLPLKVYYARPYAIYEGENHSITVYGEKIISFSFSDKL